jgi:hypothetical protein
VSNEQRKEMLMRTLGWVAVLVALAFGLGASGLPGDAMAAAADWLVDSGRVELQGPIGEAVRQAM